MPEIEIAPGVAVIEPDPKPEWAVKCPVCKAEKGRSCVYVSTVREWESRWDPNAHRRRTVQVTRHTKGQVTKRSHIERLVAYGVSLRGPKPKPVLSVSPVLVAVAAFDRAEYEQTKAWLRENWTILVRSER